MATQSKFGAWVLSYSVMKLAKTLRVSKVAVYKWIKGESSPRLGTMLKIRSLSKGKIKPQDILAARAKSYVRSPVGGGRAPKAAKDTRTLKTLKVETSAKAQPALKAASHKKLKAGGKTKFEPTAKTRGLASRLEKKTLSTPKSQKKSKRSK